MLAVLALLAVTAVLLVAVAAAVVSDGRLQFEDGSPGSPPRLTPASHARLARENGERACIRLVDATKGRCTRRAGHWGSCVDQHGFYGGPHHVDRREARQQRLSRMRTEMWLEQTFGSGKSRRRRR